MRQISSASLGNGERRNIREKRSAIAEASSFSSQSRQPDAHSPRCLDHLVGPSGEVASPHVVSRRFLDQPSREATALTSSRALLDWLQRKLDRTARPETLEAYRKRRQTG